jgi:aspartate/methionine/tyrosine aminotransferase
MAFFEPFALERFFAEREFGARHLLCCSDCESMSVEELLSLEGGARERLMSLRLGYTETRGDPGLRAAVAALYRGIGPESVLVHSGAEEAILNFCLGALSPGDHVVVNFPCYQSLAEIPRALGCAVDPWPLRVAGGRWSFDPDSLARLLRPRTRMVVLNAPHNPTGALPTAEEYGAIVELCRRAGAILFGDEVYAGLEYEGGRALAPACEAYENGVSLNVLSKSWGLPGLRIGWLASRRADLLDAAAEAKDYNSICASGPSEMLALVAVRHREDLVGRSRKTIASNLPLLDAFLARRKDFAAWTRPEAGPIGFPVLAPGSPWKDAAELSASLFEESGVLLLPGGRYFCDPRAFRIGFGRAAFPEALAALEAWLERSREA